MDYCSPGAGSSRCIGLVLGPRPWIPTREALEQFSMPVLCHTWMNIWINA